MDVAAHGQCAQQRQQVLAERARDTAVRQFQDGLARAFTRHGQCAAHDALGDAAQVVADCDGPGRQ